MVLVLGDTSGGGSVDKLARIAVVSELLTYAALIGVAILNVKAFDSPWWAMSMFGGAALMCGILASVGLRRTASRQMPHARWSSNDSFQGAAEAGGLDAERYLRFRRILGVVWPTIAVLVIIENIL